MSTQGPLRHPRQKGVSLVIALILLLVLTIIGIASMNTSLMQERMAGNVNLQTLAFEAASAGIVDSLDFLDTSSWPECGRGNVWTTEFQAFQQLDGLVGSPPLPPGIRVGYQLRAGCFDDPIPEWNDWEEDIPVQLLVLSRGVVCRGAGCTGANLPDENVLAVREVEVRVSPVGGGDPACLLNIGPVSGAAKAIGVGKSKGHLVDGGDGGCPIQFADSNDADRFASALGDRVGQYRPNPPGITSARPNSRGLWEDGENLARLVNAVKVGVRAYSAWDPIAHGANNPFQECAGYFHPPGTGKSKAFPGPIPYEPGRFITYIAEDLDTAGMSKGTIRDSIVFVEGELDISGTTPYQGADFVALGGSFNASGWGKAENSGLIYLESLESRNADPQQRVAYDPDTAAMGLVSKFNISGFGTAEITADDCDDMQERWRQLNRCIGSLREQVSEANGAFLCGGGPCVSNFQYYIEEVMGGNTFSDRSLGSADPLKDFDVPALKDNEALFDIPGCGGPPGGFGTRNVITSWREYIDRVRWQ